VLQIFPLIYNRRDYNEKGRIKMGFNGDSIRQLYQEAAGEARKDTIVEKADNGFILHTINERPVCLKPFYRFFHSVCEAFPDYKLFLDNILVKQNRVMARYTISGTQKRDFMGLEATNEPMTITGIDIFHLEEGEVVEYWDAAHQINCASKQTRNLSGGPPEGLVTAASKKKQPSLST
jgi:predicted ester cyclase